MWLVLKNRAEPSTVSRIILDYGCVRRGVRPVRIYIK